MEDQPLEYKKNIKGDEARAVLLCLLAQCNEEDDVKKLHQIVGHTNFAAMLLEEDEEAEVQKVHRYFGHRSGRKVWEMFAKSGRLRNKKQATIDFLDKCDVCRKMKKRPPKPKVGMPVANNFNEVVGLDLKVLENGKYILWMVDMFSKAIKGKFITNKEPGTIVKAIIDSWIVGDGFGPGHPALSFYSDNGGEFLNQEMIDFAATLDTTIRMTSSHAPWQNGTVERHHATADIIVSKILSDDPKMNIQDAVNKASLAKNSEVNQSGFSALQLVMGQNPTFPGLGDVSQASNNLDSCSRSLKAL